ncbi:XRE family transcriptional regulator [Prescottella equi]|uniref:XRE family transcriptional regulator n=1 Tax=Rhodococcus hoagii TaxID=43767 RepID=UPI00111BD1DF|nr:XRE family transcriptional regulator [Prescottella equi]
MAYAIRLRRDELEHHMAAAGMTQQKDLAAAMHMSEPAISRALNHGRFGEGFIAGLLGAFPSLAFEDFFEIVAEERRYTVRQAAQRLGAPEAWYTEQLIAGVLPGRMIRSQWWLTERDIAACVDRLANSSRS